MQMKRLLILPLVVFLFRAQAQHVPSIEEVISLQSVGSVQLSPDGKTIAYTVQTTDWNDNSALVGVALRHKGGFTNERSEG